MFKRILNLIIVFICVFSTTIFSGCTGEAFNIYFGVDEMPKNIDPQKAQSFAELLTVRNCFRGLYKQGVDGEPVPDLAEDTEISDDGLTYTFTLKTAEWQDGTSVTSDDFLFALERASDPVTAAPQAHKLNNIVGVPERLEGGSGSIGVLAPDGKTLIIKLIKPDKTFSELLTSAVYMPCNREFFESTGGKYGLDRKNILTNGYYYPSQWSENRHLKLTPVSEAEDQTAENIYLSVSTTGKNSIQRVKAKEVGMTVDSINDYTAMTSEDYTVKTLYQKNYVLIFNQSTELGSNEQLTEAFAKAVHKELYFLKMSPRFKNAETVLPENSIFSGRTLGDIDPKKHSIEFDPESARSLFLEAVSQLKSGRFPDASVLTVDNAEIKSVLNEIVSQWQSTLGAYMNISTVTSEQALIDRVSSGNYTVALIPVSYDVSETLHRFSDKNSGYYINDPEYDIAVEALDEANDMNAVVNAVERCCEILSSESCVIPVISVPTAYIYDKQYKNVVFSTVDSTVDFSIIYK